METAILACQTLADELQSAVVETGCSHSIIWVESGLHRSIKSLHLRLQQELNSIGNAEQVLLAFGFCGNALLGIKAPNFRLIFPRVDDCITLLLGPQEKSKKTGTYYMTRGWLEYENNIWQEYQELVNRYGQAKADRVFKVMLAGYQKLAVIDTGGYSLKGFLGKSAGVAEALGLKHQVVPGTLRYLKKLLTGPWDDEFVVIEPGETVTLQELPSG